LNHDTRSNRQPIPRREAEQTGATEWLRRLAAMYAEDRSPAVRLRELLLPTMLKLIVKPEKMAWQRDYRIDWDEPAG
jgi:hypothetical protein